MTKARVHWLMWVPLALSACATMPPAGPTTLWTPPAGVPWDQFQRDDAYCRQYASDQGMTGAQQQTQGALTGAAAGAALGAVAGAMSDGGGDNVVAGASVGALLGSVTGANGAAAYGGDAQGVYDQAYQQCMGAKEPVSSGYPPPPAPGVGAVPPDYPSAPYAPPPGYGPPP